MFIVQEIGTVLRIVTLIGIVTILEMPNVLRKDDCPRYCEFPRILTVTGRVTKGKVTVLRMEALLEYV